jgi:hypothetical protein
MTRTIRDSNLELYRIILMLAIVAHHYVVNSGLIGVMRHDPIAPKSLYLFLFGMWGKTGINCFILITGYFMCKSEITLRKFLKLLFEVEFYNIVIMLAFLFSGYYHPSWKEMLMMLFPVRSVSDGFTSCFIVFYLFIPFLSVLVRNLSQYQHKLLIILALSVYTLLANVLDSKVQCNYVTWFCVLFFIASYLRFYGLPILNYKHVGLVALLLIFTSMTSVLLVYVIKGNYFYFFVGNPNFILPTLTSLFLFLYFKDLNVPQSKIINTIASSTFGVLLIHANSDTMRQWLWGDIVNVLEISKSSNYLLLSFASVCIIYVSCVIIDQIRIHVIETPFFNFYDKYLIKRPL